MSWSYSSSSSYFVPGYGISRVVIQSEIQYMCGPDAIVRTFTLRGRDGYLVTSSGPQLTKEQIEDLRQLSVEYEERQAQRQGEESEGFLNQPIQMNNRRY